MSEIIDETLVKGERLHIKKHTIPAGAQTPKHHHKKTLEIYQGLEGAGRLVLNGKTIILKPGMIVEVPINATHQLFNDEMLPFVVLSTKDQPDTVEDFHLDI